MPFAGRRPRGGVVVALSAAVVGLLVVDGLVLAEVNRSRRRPAFSEGGDFLTAAPFATTSTPAGLTPAPPPPAVPVPTTTIAGARTTTTTTTNTTTVTTTTVTTASAPPAPIGLRPPAPGRYTFAVSGAEAASIVGSRAFEPTATLVVHPGAGLGPDRMVFDFTFSSQHEEREIGAYGPHGMSLTNEGGSITFGLITESSEVSYDPPMGYVPSPLFPGTVTTGTSTVRAPDGSTVRVDDWETRVVREETIVIGGLPVDTAVVHFARTSRPGSEVITQRATWWFDPVRGMPVKIEDEIHADRTKGILTLTYDARYTAVLS